MLFLFSHQHRFSPRLGALVLWLGYALALLAHGAHHWQEAAAHSRIIATDARTTLGRGMVSGFGGAITTPATTEIDGDCPECQALLLLGAMLLFVPSMRLGGLDGLSCRRPAFAASVCPTRRQERRPPARAPPF